MAELSKKRGEFGEELVTRLLKLIGWSNPIKGYDVPCTKKQFHRLSGEERISHGVDFIYQYDCPLFARTQELVLVSSK